MHTAASTIVRQPAVPLRPVVDPAAWTKAELVANTDWLYPLSADEIADLDRAIVEIERKQTPLMEIGRADFDLPVLGPVLDRMRAEILDGRGFVWIRGVPVHRYTRLQSAIVYWGIGSYIGIPVSQNAKGHLLGHVVDLGDKSLANANHRGYQTSSTLPFHADYSDVVGLLCLQRAKSGGESAIASSVTLYNEMLKRYPTYAAALSGPVFRDRRGEVPEGAKPYFEQPVFNVHEGHLTTHFGAPYIKSAQRFEELPRFTPELAAAIETFEELARELCFSMEFLQGDIQLLNNHVIIHSRLTDVEDYPEPERRRHLLRLWLSTPGGRPLPPAYYNRYARPFVPGGERPGGGITIPGMKLNVPMEPE